MNRRVFALVWFAALLLFGARAPAALAQGAPPSNLTITGVVLDTSGGVAPGATVVLRSAGGRPRTEVTDATGRFTFSNVSQGVATLVVTLDAFAPREIEVQPGQGDIRVVLQPSPLTEQVTVEAVLQTRTATRTTTPLRDVPQAITTISKNQIADLSMQGLGDVVRYVPGAGMAQGEGNRDAVVLRGNTSTADFFVDGIRDDVQYFRDLYNVDRVEALKGPNAMIFGRGGVGGVINRVSKKADWTRVREVTVQAGTFANRRVAADLGDGMEGGLAYRVTGLFENSGSYRQGVSLEREGLNPSFGLSLGSHTTIRVAYEYFHDKRTADRGIPSLNGAPLHTDPDAFFGDAGESRSDARVNSVGVTAEHVFAGGAQIRNHTLVADYDKFYQNVFPGAVNATAMTVSISGYNNRTDRMNVFNQTDITASRVALGLTHRLLVGTELGRQATDNRRMTGYFTSVSATATSVAVPVGSPAISLPISFRPSATDADNSGAATVAAAYVQDQVRLGRHVEVVGGLRFDRFEVDVTNNRTGQQVGSSDNLVSPRVGLIIKPLEVVSVYTSYTLSYLPRAGEQLSSLSVTNQSLDPEVFRNYEVGAKWDVRPALSVTAAAYRLNRGNVSITDPADPTRTILVDGQRTKGVELGPSGTITPAWTVLGAYAYQDGEVTSRLSSTVLAGASLANLPEHSWSLWNRYDVSRVAGVGLGLIHRGAVFASTDNLVALPSFTRADAAVFLRFGRHLRAQANLENLLDTRYYASAHSNNNITPGSPRALRVGLTTLF
jgi:catecholate siderophore receptor